MTFKSARTLTIFCSAMLLAITTATAGDCSLEQGFTNPPAQTKPWCYYYWISDNISKEGITHDL